MCLLGYHTDVFNCTFTERNISAYGMRVNFEGSVCVDSGAPSMAYTQLFRNGVIEAVRAGNRTAKGLPNRCALPLIRDKRLREFGRQKRRELFNIGVKDYASVSNVERNIFVRFGDDQNWFIQ